VGHSVPNASAVLAAKRGILANLAFAGDLFPPFLDIHARDCGKPLRATKDRRCIPKRIDMQNLAPIDIEPAVRGLLPGFRVRMTRALWTAIAGRDPVTAEDERLRDLGFYALFAIVGMVGEDDEEGKDIIVPVTFESSLFQVRIAVGRDTHEAPSLTLSLPGEKVNT
jgi:hypothetical protein